MNDAELIKKKLKTEVFKDKKKQNRLFNQLAEIKARIFKKKSFKTDLTKSFTKL